MVWRTYAPGLSVITGPAGLNDPRWVPPGYCSTTTPDPPDPPNPPPVFTEGLRAAGLGPGPRLLPDPPPPPPVLAVPEVAGALSLSDKLVGVEPKSAPVPPAPPPPTVTV